MSLTLTTNVGGANSDSLVSVTEFDAFLDRRLGGAKVKKLSPDIKAQGLLHVMPAYDALLWRGARATTTQALSHPRASLPKRDVVTLEAESDYEQAYFYSTTEIAQPVKDGQCEWAFLVLSGEYDFSEQDAPVIAETVTNGVTLRYANNGRTASNSGSVPPSVARIISGLVRGARLVAA